MPKFIFFSQFTEVKYILIYFPLNFSVFQVAAMNVSAFAQFRKYKNDEVISFWKAAAV